MAWPPATYAVISCNHSDWPALNLPQNLRERWTNSYRKRQVLMFYPLGKNSKKPYGGDPPCTEWTSEGYYLFTVFRWPYGKKSNRSCDERLDHPYERLYNIQEKNRWNSLCVHVQRERVGLLHLQLTKHCYDAHLLSQHLTYVFDKTNFLSISHRRVVIIIFLADSLIFNQKVYFQLLSQIWF